MARFQSHATNGRPWLCRRAQRTADLPEVARAIYVGGPGTIVAQLLSGAEVSFAAVPAGQHPADPRPARPRGKHRDQSGGLN